MYLSVLYRENLCTLTLVVISVLKCNIINFTIVFFILLITVRIIGVFVVLFLKTKSASTILMREMQCYNKWIQNKSRNSIRKWWIFFFFPFIVVGGNNDCCYCS